MHLEAALEQDLCVVADDRWLALEVYRHKLLRRLVLDLVGAQDHTLAVEVRQDIISADVLYAPVKRVEDVGLLGDELVVGEGDADVLEQLLHARVRHLVVLRADEDACSGDQRHDLVVSLVAEVADADDVLLNIGHLQVGIEHVHTVVERFRVVLQLAAQVPHPVDKELTGADVESARIVALA